MIWLCVAGRPSVHAHSDLEELLEEANERISREPRSGAHYLNRGEVYRIHRLWRKALRDYAKAESMDPSLNQVWYCRGRLYYESGRPMSGVEELTRFLKAHPDDGQARLVRGRCWVQLKNPTQARADYEVALKHLPTPGPEVFLEYAATFPAPGEREKARAILEDGRRQLGPVITLDLPLLQLYRQLGNREAAMGLLEEMLKRSPEDAELLELRTGVVRGEMPSAQPGPGQGDQPKRK